GIGDALRVSDLAATAGVRVLDDEDEVLASVTPPTVVDEPEGVEGEEVEGEELPEGAEAAAEGVEAAEPEEPSEEQMRFFRRGAQERDPTLDLLVAWL